MADSSQDWIEHAIKHHGAFKAKAEKAGKSTEEYAKESIHKGGLLGHQANLALTLRNMHSDGQGLKEKSDKHPEEYSTEDMPKS